MNAIQHPEDGEFEPAGSALKDAAERLLASPRRWGLQPIGKLLAKPTRTEWLVDKHLERGGLDCLFGPSGVGKSFIAVDLAACISTGTSWHGHKVHPGGVAYLAAEGRNGLRRRLLAWSIDRGVDLSDAPLYLSTGAIDLLGSVGEIAEAIRSACGAVTPVLVIVDTVARHLVGDENSSQDMGALVAACDRIRDELGCGILLVHHSGHMAAERERGSSALRASLDWSYSAQRGDSGPVLLQCRKAKDHPEPAPMQFNLTSVQLPWADEDGEPETSAVLVPAGDTAAGLGANQLLAMTALRRLAPQGPVTLAAWRAAAGIDRRRWADCRTTLTERGLVLVDGEEVRLPDPPSPGVRPVPPLKGGGTNRTKLPDESQSGQTGRPDVDEPDSRTPRTVPGKRPGGMSGGVSSSTNEIAPPPAWASDPRTPPA